MRIFPNGLGVGPVIAATRDFKGVTGLITLDAQRNASKSAVVVHLKEGAFRYFETVNP